MEKDKLLFYRFEGREIFRKIVNDNELIRMIDESDFTGLEIIKILCITDPDNIFELHYAGWQPGCLIEVKDDEGRTVVRGYGTDH